MDILKLVEQNQQSAWNVLEDTGIIMAGESIGDRSYYRFAQIRLNDQRQG
jgi:hypothetical protein